MGGELVDSSNPISSYTDIFNEQFPYYLSIGMTYDQYWNDDCLLVKYYRKASKIRDDRKNHELWLQGLYIYQALCDVSPVLHAFAKNGTKPNPYPDRPYAITAEEVEERKEEGRKADRAKARAVFEAWASTLDLPKGKDVSTDAVD